MPGGRKVLLAIELRLQGNKNITVRKLKAKGAMSENFPQDSLGKHRPETNPESLR
jgi:hypothetical protein